MPRIMVIGRLRPFSFAALLMALSLLCAARGARADVNIFVANPSFETLPDSGLPYSCTSSPGCSYNTGPIPGWNTSGSVGQLQPGSSSGNLAIFNYVPDGVTVAYADRGKISQTVGSVMAGDTYTLSVDFGTRNVGQYGVGYAFLQIGDSIFDFATGTYATSGSWTPWTAIFTGTALTAGDPIDIVLGSVRSQGDFDNVSLTSTPEPAFYGMLALGLGGLMLAARKRAGRNSA